eukprot:TRINITY_DN76_c3_g1_i1.p1 TRINITY_DN76_c3_g1~~TRINITY_DN76_c3_g1_i1.p1  ORF type:complete len:239 (-),score=89.48 TRINITY_DN76_c3_g1_i1:348-1064(-)
MSFNSTSTSSSSSSSSSSSPSTKPLFLVAGSVALVVIGGIASYFLYTKLLKPKKDVEAKDTRVEKLRLQGDSLFKQYISSSGQKKELAVKAIQYYTEALAIHQTDKFCLLHRATTYLQLQKYDECLRDLETLLKLLDSAPKPLSNKEKRMQVKALFFKARAFLSAGKISDGLILLTSIQTQGIHDIAAAATQYLALFSRAVAHKTKDEAMTELDRTMQELIRSDGLLPLNSQQEKKTV